MKGGEGEGKNIPNLWKGEKHGFSNEDLWCYFLSSFYRDLEQSKERESAHECIVVFVEKEK